MNISTLLYLFYVSTVFWSFVCNGIDVQSQAGEIIQNQGFEGRAFGSSHSNDVGRRIAIGEDGFIYMGGTSTPKSANYEAWGISESGQRDQKADIFLAKLTTTGKLIWVRRSGSQHHDFMNDMKVTKDAIYVCGTTHGNFGATKNGTADAFIMKYKLNGEKGWRKPFQFGSYSGDACNAIDVDDKTKTIVATGSTNGTLFGSVGPTPNQSHHFVVTFQEVAGLKNGLKLIRGRQKGGNGFSSADQVIFNEDNVFVLTRDWNPTMDENKRATTYLYVLDKGSMIVREMHTLNTKSGDGLRGVRMALSNSTDGLYVVGITADNNNHRNYHLLKFAAFGSNRSAEIEWEAVLGHVANDVHLPYQLPCFAVHQSSNRIYVGGVEDGFYSNEATSSSGIMVVPFYMISLTNGNVEKRWHRTTTVPYEMQELTDIAIDPYGSVVYTGVWSSGPERMANALFGSFGSPLLGAVLPRDTRISESESDESTEPQKQGKTKLILFSILSVAGVGILAGVLITTGVRRYRKHSEYEVWEAESSFEKEEELSRSNSVGVQEVITFPKPEQKTAETEGSVAQQ